MIETTKHIYKIGDCFIKFETPITFGYPIYFFKIFGYEEVFYKCNIYEFVGINPENYDPIYHHKTSYNLMFMDLNRMEMIEDPRR